MVKVILLVIVAIATGLVAFFNGASVWALFGPGAALLALVIVVARKIR